MITSAFAASRARHALHVAAVTAAFAPGFGLPVTAQTLVRPDDAWRNVAIHRTDEDHAHMILEPSPFDAMTDLQLAAVPKGQRVHFNAPSKCVPARLKSVLDRVAAKYGPITVSSTFRNPSKNRSVGGKKESWHLKCGAVDFRVHGKTSGLLAYLGKQGEVGGYKRYKAGFYHIDIGPRRTW
ncbi:MAG: D-Ala-D-Ala carboxypeptidase family metallohydrolase [Oricola sp.]